MKRPGGDRRRRHGSLLLVRRPDASRWPAHDQADPASYGESTEEVHDQLYTSAFDPEGAVDILAELTRDGTLLDLPEDPPALVRPLLDGNNGGSLPDK